MTASQNIDIVDHGVTMRIIWDNVLYILAPSIPFRIFLSGWFNLNLSMEK